jgi:hypothetical protein
MALNPTHTFEDLGDVKCAIVEKECTHARVDFLKRLLEHNGFSVVVQPSPPPKVKPVAEGEAPPPPLPETFTVGVTDVTFSPINAVFNRELKTFDGSIVTKDYWKQRETEVRDNEWYWKSN